MGSLAELKKRYGSSAEKRSQYFRLMYGLRVTVQPARAGSPEEAAQLGGLQALEELCMSINDVPNLVRKVSLEPQVERYNGPATGVHGQYSSGYVHLATRETAKFATETINKIPFIQRIMLERGEGEAATSGVLASRQSHMSAIFASAEVARTEPSPSPETSPTDIKRASQRAGYAVMIHEFGHAVDFGKNGELTDLGRGQTRDTALSTRQSERLAQLQSPSRYGTVNQYEKVAESWASWWLFGGASENNSPAWATRIRTQGVQILGPILEERKDVVKSEELPLRLLDLPLTHPVTMFIVAPFISSAALIKASFGGDRSAAGRYAAEQRWKGHVKANMPKPSGFIGVSRAYSGKESYPSHLYDLALSRMLREDMAELNRRAGILEHRDASGNVLEGKNWGESLSLVDNRRLAKHTLVSDLAKGLVATLPPEVILQASYELDRNPDDPPIKPVTSADLQKPPLAGTNIEEAAYEVVNRIIGQWAQSSNDSLRLSLAIQQVVAREFGLTEHAPASVIAYANKSADEQAKELSDPKSASGKLLAAVIRQQYANTQAYFEAKGIKELTLHRGFDDDLAQVGEQEVMLRPLSSFSASNYIAQRFASSEIESGKVMIVKVPVSQIFSTPFTGIGCLTEEEFVILGKPTTASVERRLDG